MAATNPVFAHEEREASHDVAMAQLKNKAPPSTSRGSILSPTTMQEDIWKNMINDGGLDQKAKLNALLDDEVLWEKRYQRKRDTKRDHPISLFTRQKNQSTLRIVFTLVLLTLVHLLQVGAMYNLLDLSTVLTSYSISKYLLRGDWMTTSLSTIPQPFNASILAGQIQTVLNGSEARIPGLMQSKGFCLSPQGYFENMFNIAAGLFLVYLFIFADLWRVIFATTITRSFPDDPHFKLVAGGAFWLVMWNAVILTWLGVESGLSVVASAGDFHTVLFNSLSNFIILQIDDEVLPLIRFLVEENGFLDSDGYLVRKQLDLLTHGSQYYKPGYGANWVNTIRSAPSMILRVVATINIPIALAIVVAPLGFVAHSVLNSYIPC